MQSGAPKQQIKRHHHKSRNGCTSCKQRRFKCDERKPACLRCILAGKECMYKIPQAKIFPPAPSEALPNLEANTLKPLETLDPAEHRALLYFNERAVPDFTGFTSYTETFWNCLIPRLSQSEPAIRHIAIAISTKHEALHSSPEWAQEISEFGVQHHSLALQCLTHPSKDEKVDILLVSCIAFILFERLQDPYAMGGRYLDYAIAGLKILRERSIDSDNFSREDESFNLIDDFLEPMFFQIELAFSMFCQPERLVYPCTQATRPQVPEKFANTEAAREVFFQICVWRYLLNDSGQKWTDSSPGFIEIRSLLDQWHCAFDACLSGTNEDNPEEKKRAYFLRQQMCVFVGAILFSVREDVPPRRLCRPALVDLSNPTKIQIFVRIGDDRKVNLSGINSGSPAALKQTSPGLWPHAKRMRVEGGVDYILLELLRT